MPNNTERINVDVALDLTYRWCPSCEQNKVTLDFPKNKRYADGLHYECKACHSNRTRKNDLNYPETRRRARETYKQRHPEKVKEWSAAQYQRRKAARAAESTPPSSDTTTLP